MPRDYLYRHPAYIQIPNCVLLFTGKVNTSQLSPGYFLHFMLNISYLKGFVIVYGVCVMNLCVLHGVSADFMIFSASGDFDCSTVDISVTFLVGNAAGTEN